MKQLAALTYCSHVSIRSKDRKTLWVSMSGRIHRKYSCKHNIICVHKCSSSIHKHIVYIERHRWKKMQPRNINVSPYGSCYSSNFCCSSFLIRNFYCGFKNISLLLILIVFPLYSNSLLISFHFYIQYPHSVHYIILWCDVSVYYS